MILQMWKDLKIVERDYFVLEKLRNTDSIDLLPRQWYNNEIK